jgi:hypothetical protein
MFVRILVKEWRENILIFSIGVLMMLGMIALNFSGEEELTVQFSGMLLLLFVPFAALLIGSSGFSSEFKDNAWIYLLSRPIRKELIWIFKYVSQLSVLLAIFLIFFSAKRFLPGLAQILEDISFPSRNLGLVSFSLYVVIPLVEFTIAFSISLLNEKPFVTFFAAIIIGTALVFLFQKYAEFLWLNFFYIGNLSFFWLFVGLSFIAASILTFVKSDFSQPKRKIFAFSKYLVLFLTLSFLLGVAVFTKGQVFSKGRGFLPYFAQKDSGDVYFPTYRRGLLKYDSQKDKVERLSRRDRFWPFDFHFSLRGGKLAFLRGIKGNRMWHMNLWIMNADGSGKRALVETHRKESPFHNCLIQSIILSSAAEKVAFIAVEGSPGAEKRDPVLFWMDTDGTNLGSRPLEGLSSSSCRLLAWPPGENYLILLAEGKRPPQQPEKKIIKVDLESGISRVLAGNGITEHHVTTSPDQSFMAFIVFDSSAKRKALSVLNLKTLEQERVAEAEPQTLGLCKWNQDGNKIVYSLDLELCIFDVNKKESRSLIKADYDKEIGRAFDWLSGGNGLAVISSMNGENHLRILDEGSGGQKTIKIPFRVEQPVYLWGLEEEVLLMNARRGPLWRVDLKTGGWKKVY